jgi:8-amino-7-oxononanoate synthase
MRDPNIHSANAMSGLDRYETALAELTGQSRLRSLAPRSGLDFTSNDYLGLSTSKRLAQSIMRALLQGTAVGSGGSRLLRGNAPEHEELEARAAAFFHAESALFFGSGYVANCSLLSTLPQNEDLLILDELVHASAHQGARAGRARSIRTAHNSADVIEREILAWRARGGLGRIWIAVESLYSMEGDRSPLAELVALADRYDAFLLIDEAHATGIYGPDGRGLAAQYEGRDNVVVLHTCGKALGGAGALITGPRVLRAYLINRCRPFIYATAPSPLMAVAALEALAILKDEPDRRERLATLVLCANREIATRAICQPSGSHILPIILGDDRRAMDVAVALQARGFDVRGVRPPTVPEGTARLRISLTLNVDEAAILGLFAALADVLQGAHE